MSQPPWGPAPPPLSNRASPGCTSSQQELSWASVVPVPPAPGLPAPSAAQRWVRPSTEPRLRAEAAALRGARPALPRRYPRGAARPGLRCQMGPRWRPPRSQLSILSPAPPLPRPPPPLRAPPTARAAAGVAARMVQPAPASPMEGTSKEASASPPRLPENGIGGPGACREL